MSGRIRRPVQDGAPVVAGAGGRGRRDDRILPYTRLVAAVLLPFLAVASVLVYLLPGRTEALFAWTIEPPFTAMLLGCAYIGGVVYFVGVVRARRWHRIWTGMPAVLAFATMAGTATLLHLDRFHPGHISFITWLTLYLTTPVLVLVLIALNSPRDPRVPEEHDVRVPLLLRVLLGAFGVAAVVAGITLFAAPDASIPVWAWTLTPLTARITGAVLVLPGLVDVLLLVDPRWSAFRLIFEAQLVSLVFIVAAVVIRASDILWDRPAAPLFVGALVVSLVAYVAMLIGMTARVRRQ